MEKGMEKIRHSLAHVLAAAVKEIYPEVKLGMGPAIDSGFYYDFDGLPKEFGSQDLPKIEKRMREIIEKNISFEKKEVSKQKAGKIFSRQPYKLELIEEIEQSKVGIYESGGFIDLCKGPHVSSTGEIPAQGLELDKVAGAYWRGSEENKMLTRLYGLAFESKKGLEKFKKRRKEAQKRDHKKLGRKLDLFFLSPYAPGIPFWQPKGMILRNLLFQRWKKIQKEYGYREVKGPDLLSVDIFKESGHWDHYKDEMFIIEGKQGQRFALRPMDCPGEIQIYKHKLRSYKDLPIKYSEMGTVFRNEKSGELNGLLRVSQMVQDDAHIFMTQNQIQEQVGEVLQITEKLYAPFGFQYQAYLSTRPEDFMGDIALWNKAEQLLKKVMKEAGLPLLIKEKEGAFYGPKIDYQLEDALGRTWQCGTIQLDFFMPERFELEYVGEDGKKHRPIICHRALMGSIERFIGILIEHYGGAFPVWLSPVQMFVIPVGSQNRDYARKVGEILEENGFRTEVKQGAETVSKKIRKAETQNIPYMLVVGDREEKKEAVAVRDREKGDVGMMELGKFIKKVKKEIAQSKNQK